ncbi:hypothetical protein BKA56DRAFT_589663 [Ilyonectria sp. MPI-CAGE-AT-0026]|nr:hypothetical protein BKA56DRAFT_589663 [Ilyonectria sp. MPI-CAGE-AT-0026]
MTTGLEALGAASAVLQVISFSCNVVSLCHGIYDGKPTVEHDLEDYASGMIDAAGRLQTRCQAMPQMTDAEKKLAEIGRKCQETAKDLEKETQAVTQLCQKGTLYKAAWATLRSSKHRKNIERLQKSLEGYRGVMETQLMLELCTNRDAIELKQSQGFGNLSDDVQALVSQIANGHTKMEDLVNIEHSATRDLVIREAERTRGEVNTHVVSEMQALGARAATDSQREGLLKSLKVDVMNQRYNDVMDSNDSTFERVFHSFGHMSYQGDPNDGQSLDVDAVDESDSSSYTESDWSSDSEDMIPEIDEKWCGFISWLQSDKNKIFWIRGKPGSGKSTLMKFIIDNDNTERLLDRWRPGTKILGHFFWKIGSQPQNSIKGLLCSLTYCILSGCNRKIDQVLGRFDNALSKDSYHDWSSAELEKILFSLLEEDDYPVCIFIDGLDEISDEDGYFKLQGVIERMNTWNNIKVCVSSRPETQLVEGFETLGATSIRLEDLTRPEMSTYVNKQLQQFSSDGRISAPTLWRLTDGLLHKAQGVFLWLFLATRSLVNGIHNRDDEDTLLQRLEQLPGELENLYADMWRRLNGDNSVYRETAGRYLRYAVTRRSLIRVTVESRPQFWFFIQRPTLLEVTLAERPDNGELLASEANGGSFDDLMLLAHKTAGNVHTRCAGLLQLSKSRYMRGKILSKNDGINTLMQQMDFIHRTAHDFLLETQAGQSILNYKHVASLSVNSNVTLVKAMLCTLRILHRELAFFKVNARDVISSIAWAAPKSGDVKSETTSMLLTAYELFESRALSFPSAWYIRPLFVSLLKQYSPLFDDWVISSVEWANSSVINKSLHEIAIEWGSFGYLLSPTRVPRCPTRVMQKRILMGADPHAITLWPVQDGGNEPEFAQQVTAYGLFLTFAMNRFWKAPDASGLVDVIDTMAQTCTNWQTTILLVGERSSSTHRFILRPRSLRGYQGGTDLFCEVNLQFLLLQFLAAVEPIHPVPQESRLRKLAKTLTKPVAIIRFIMQDNECYRVLNQQPFQDVLRLLLDPTTYDHVDLQDLIDAPARTKKVDLETELNMLSVNG